MPEARAQWEELLKKHDAIFSNVRIKSTTHREARECLNLIRASERLSPREVCALSDLIKKIYDIGHQDGAEWERATE